MYFKTIATLDLETTTLTLPKITEISVIACEREHCEETNNIPRVLHKLTICINPKTKIHPSSTSITGLNNIDLANVSCFDKRVNDILENFLGRLPKPVCLVAHNGFKFDFPILKRELRSCGESNFEDIYCADSLLLFRAMFSIDKRVVAEFNSPKNDRICVEAAEKVEEENEVRTLNESTPEKKMNPLLLAPKKAKLRSSRFVDSSARRKLNFNCDESTDLQSTSDNIQSSIELGPLRIHFNCRGSPKSYKLSDIYIYLFGYPFVDSHRAENDAQALLECLVKCSTSFKWIDAHAVPLHDV